MWNEEYEMVSERFSGEIESNSNLCIRQLGNMNGILDKANKILSSILDSSPDVIVFALDCDYCYLSFNANHKETIKAIWGKEIAIGMNMLSVIGDHVDGIKAKANFDRALSGESFSLTEEYGDEAISRLFWQNFWSPFYSQTGEIMGLTCFVLNITDRKRLEMDLSREKMLLETTLTSVGDGVISTDNKGNIVFLNKVGEALTGWTQEAARGKPIEEVFIIVNEYTREKNENIVEKVLASGKVEELANHTVLIAKDGSERPIEDSAAPIIQENGKIAGVVLVFRDFSEKKQKQEEIEFLSYHDQLTGLYNRRFYEEELIRLDVEKSLPLTIVMGDVNGLKLVNDSFGHVMGDQLLKKVAEVLKKSCRSCDIIARLGGDEFVIILPNTDDTGAEKIIKRIKELSLRENVAGINLSVSVGYDIKKNEYESIGDVFKSAEDQMYRNKLSVSSSMRSKTIDLIMSTLYEKNTREMLHSKRVGEICEAIALNLNFSKDDVNQIRIAGLMHDIGKIGVDENILNNPQKLNYDEWKEMKKHPEIGYRILSSVNEFSEIADYVLEHQEKWNGKGYPRGLKGQEISVQARIIAIADAYDAMTSERTYFKALSEEEAIHEIKRCADTQFDPAIAKLFVENILGQAW